MPMIPISLIASMLLSTTPAPHGDLDVERFMLDNGLRVRLVAVPEATDIALMTLFDIGDYHDPPGRSGLGHFIEHVYVTAAAGDIPARTTADFYAAYGRRANAQTGHDYTVFGAVSESWKLEDELRGAAARMGNLKIVPDDLERELPRIEAELHTMYEGVPDLAALCWLRATLNPKATDAHWGGDLDQLRQITAADLIEHHARYYKPRNAQLILVGGFDPAKARDFIERFFGEIQSGEVRPAMTTSVRADLPVLMSRTVPKTPSGSWPRQFVSIGFCPPAGESEHFPAFVVWWGMLNKQMRDDMGEHMMNARRGILGPAPLMFAPLDEPLLMTLSGPVKGEATAEEVIDALQAKVDDAAGITEDTPLDGSAILKRVGASYGLSSQQKQIARLNPYLTAFIIGRREQMGIDPGALSEAVKQVTPADIKRCIADLFDASHRVSMVITVE